MIIQYIKVKDIDFCPEVYSYLSFNQHHPTVLCYIGHSKKNVIGLQNLDTECLHYILSNNYILPSYFQYDYKHNQDKYKKLNQFLELYGLDQYQMIYNIDHLGNDNLVIDFSDLLFDYLNNFLETACIQWNDSLYIKSLNKMIEQIFSIYIYEVVDKVISKINIPYQLIYLFSMDLHRYFYLKDCYEAKIKLNSDQVSPQDLKDFVLLHSWLYLMSYVINNTQELFDNVLLSLYRQVHNMFYTLLKRDGDVSSCYIKHHKIFLLDSIINNISQPTLIYGE